jgi:hypothetical protein
MINKRGICEQCGEDSIITKPRLGLCYKCNNKRLRKQKSNKKEASGQYDLFLEIWDRRGPYSFVSNKPLSDFKDSKLFVNCFAHVLGKGAYPAFKLREDNIVLLTPQEHFLFDHGTSVMREKYAEANNCSWEPLYHLKEILKKEYYEKN